MFLFLLFLFFFIIYTSTIENIWRSLCEYLWQGQACDRRVAGLYPDLGCGVKRRPLRLFGGQLQRQIWFVCIFILIHVPMTNRANSSCLPFLK